jgi:hypothetical protein
VRCETKTSVNWSVNTYVEVLQFRRSFKAIDANQIEIAQFKLRLIHIDSLLSDDATFIRCLDEKVGHEEPVNVSIGGWWCSSSTFVALMKVLHGGDQLPFRPHSDAVGWEESVEDLERDKGGEMEVLQCNADGGGALADHADVCRCGEEFEEARASVLLCVEAQRQRIVPQLRNSESDGWAGAGRRKDLTVTCVAGGKRSSSIGSQWS